MKLPSILLDTKKFVTGTQDMSVCEVGAYIRLLCYQHQHGYIPDEADRQMRVVGVFDREEWAAIWSIVGEKFVKVGNHLVNQRLQDGCAKTEKTTKVKRISATFAGLISSTKVLTDAGRAYLKKSFDVNDYISCEDEELKNAVKKWFNQMVEKMVSIEGNQMVNNLYFNYSLESIRESNKKGVKGEVVNHMVDEQKIDAPIVAKMDVVHPKGANGQFVPKAASPDPDDVLDIKADTVWMERMMMNHQCTESQILATYATMRAKEMKMSDMPLDRKKWLSKLQNYIFNDYTAGKYKSGPVKKTGKQYDLPTYTQVQN